MAVPIAATAATLAYLNARWRLPIDYAYLGSIAKATRLVRKREQQDRINCFYLLEEHVQNRSVASGIFLLYEDRTWTFQQFYDNVLHYAGWLHSTHGVAQGEVVAIDFMNGPEMLFLLVAVWSLGAVPALINYNLTGDPLLHSVRISSARLLFVESEVAVAVLTSDVQAKLASPTFRNGQLPLTTVVLDRDLLTSISYFKQYRAPDSARSTVGGSNTSLLMSTSGTTGLPKQAIIPWIRNHLTGLVVSQYCATQSVTTRHPDRTYTSIPLYHGTAFWFGFMLSLVSASSIVVARRFSVSGFWPDVKKYNVTIIQYVGETLRYLLAAPREGLDERAHKVRLAHGNGLRPDVWKQFKARFGIETILEYYGATEGVVGCFNPNRNDFSDGAIGQTGKLTELLLSRSQALAKVDWETESPWRDPNTGFCTRMPRGQPGELIVKLDAKDAKTAFVGYHNNKQATDAKILRDVFVQGDAWYRTGDVMRWDVDGRFWFSDRIGDTFRWKSENISTIEVGEVIGYHPAVVEANIYGVTVPGHEGRAGCAAIRFSDSMLTERESVMTVKPEVLESLATYARNSLSKAAVPVFLRVVKEMVVTGTNKSLKTVLRNQGIDLDAIDRDGRGDQLYWLRPGAESYAKFEAKQLEELKLGKVKL